jgi:hypothetical protein
MDLGLVTAPSLSGTADKEFVAYFYFYNYDSRRMPEKIADLFPLMAKKPPALRSFRTAGMVL